MKSSRLPLLIVFLSLLIPFRLQASAPNTFSPLEDEIMNFLPPLSVLIDSAIQNNPYVRFRDLQLLIDDCKLKGIKTEWTRYLGLQGELRYGTYDSYVSTNGTSTMSTTSSNDLRWSTSTFFSIPLETFLNRKNQMRQSKLEREQAKSMAEVQRNELRQVVVRQYNDLLLKQKILKIKSKFKVTSDLNMQMTEKGFTDGTVPMNEYAMITENNNRAETDFATASVEFQTAYQLLEVICGMKFNLSNTNTTQNEGN